MKNGEIKNGYLNNFIVLKVMFGFLKIIIFNDSVLDLEKIANDIARESYSTMKGKVTEVFEVCYMYIFSKVFCLYYVLHYTPTN